MAVSPAESYVRQATRNHDDDGMYWSLGSAPRPRTAAQDTFEVCHRQRIDGAAARIAEIAVHQSTVQAEAAGK